MSVVGRISAIGMSQKRKICLEAGCAITVFPFLSFPRVLFVFCVSFFTARQGGHLWVMGGVSVVMWGRVTESLGGCIHAAKSG